MKEWFKSLWEDSDKFQLALSLVFSNVGAAILMNYTEPTWLISLAVVAVNVAALKTNKKVKK